MSKEKSFQPSSKCLYRHGDRSTAGNCSSINVGCLNCRSAGTKAAVIHDIISDYRLDFLALSETWFTSNTPDAVMNDISPTDYAALHVPRSLSADRDGPSRGGGVSIVHRESVVVRRHRLADEFRPSTCELQVVRVSSSSSLAYAVFHVYRPPWMSTVPAFADELADMIATFAAKCNDHIIIILRRSELPRYGQFPRGRAPVNSV